MENPNATGGESAETLVVVSRVKKFVRDQSGLNTSQCTIEALSNLVSQAIAKAIESAKNDGRKTVMGRDFGV